MQGFGEAADGGLVLLPGEPVLEHLVDGVALLLGLEGVELLEVVLERVADLAPLGDVLAHSEKLVVLEDSPRSEARFDVVLIFAAVGAAVDGDGVGRLHLGIAAVLGLFCLRSRTVLL